MLCRAKVSSVSQVGLDAATDSVLFFPTGGVSFCSGVDRARGSFGEPKVTPPFLVYTLSDVTSDGSWLWAMRGVASRFASFRRERRRHENAERTGGIDAKELRLQPWPSWCGGSNPAGEDADHDPSGRRSARLVPRPGRFGWRGQLPDVDQYGSQSVRRAAARVDGDDSATGGARGALERSRLGQANRGLEA